MHGKAPAEALSRRGFLGALGAGAMTPGLCVMGSAHAQTAPNFTIREDRFGRIFPNLPTFAEPTPELSAAMLEIGRPGGIMDARDPLERGPILLITDPTLSVNNPDNPTHTAARRSSASSSIMT